MDFVNFSSAWPCPPEAFQFCCSIAEKSPAVVDCPPSIVLGYRSLTPCRVHNANPRPVGQGLKFENAYPIGNQTANSIDMKEVEAEI